jgi:flagellar motor switch protein FliM
MSEESVSVLEQASGPWLYCPGDVKVPLDESLVKPFLFRQKGFLSSSDVSELAGIHRKLLSRISARLVGLLRMEFKFDLESVEISSALGEQVLPKCADHQVMFFQADGVQGIGRLAFSKGLCFSVANRLLGGTGNIFSSPDRNPSEIEVALVEEVAVVVLDEWSKAMEVEGQASLKVLISGNEVGGEKVAPNLSKGNFFYMSASIDFGDMMGETFVFAVPVSMIEERVEAMSARSIEADLKTAEKPVAAKAVNWRASYAGINVPVVADWEVTDITIEEVLKLAPGSLIRLPSELLDNTRIRVGDTDEFTGTVGQEDGRLAVHITNRIEKE